jgi:hypothetical protein
VSTTPRIPKLILVQRQQVAEILNEYNLILLEDPDDALAKLSQGQYEYIISQLDSELMESYKYYGVQNCVLAIDESVTGFNLKSLLPLLAGFQKVMDATQKWISNGKKSYVPLQFNAVVPRSFGLSFSIHNGQELYGNTYSDVLGILFDSLREMTEAPDNYTIKEIIDRRLEGHKEVLISYRTFFEASKKIEKPIKLEWNAPDGESLRFSFSKKTSEVLAQELKKSLTSSENPIEIEGEIKGYSHWKNHVEFYAPDHSTPKIIASLARANAETIDKAIILNIPRIATFAVKTVLNELTDELVEEYFLTDIKPL